MFPARRKRSGIALILSSFPILFAKIHPDKSARVSGLCAMLTAGFSVPCGASPGLASTQNDTEGCSFCVSCPHTKLIISKALLSF